MTGRIPTFNDLMNQCLDELHVIRKTCSNNELRNHIKNRLHIDNLTQKEEKDLRRVTAWVKTYFIHYGLLESGHRGEWKLTPFGKSIEKVNPNEVRTRYYNDKNNLTK